MKKFKKGKSAAIRKAIGGDFPYEEGPALFNLIEDIRSDMARDIVSPRDAAERAKRMGLRAAEPKIAPLQDPSMRSYASPGMASLRDVAGRPFASPGSQYESGDGMGLSSANIARFLKDTKRVSPAAVSSKRPTSVPQSKNSAASSSQEAVSEPKKYMPRGMTNAMDQYRATTPDLEMPPALAGSSSAPNIPMAQMADLSKLAGEIPKTKSGLKKFMQDYGKFIALGAMAGAGGKGGQIAAPIIAALPGLIEMMKKKKKSQFDEKPMSAPGVQVGMAHGGSMKKSSGGETPKKSEGGAIRKFKGGSMKGNTMDSTLTPKYAKGGKTMGKATGEMSQHKKMAMGKPTPQSTGQKFAKGGTTKCAGGGMPRGYGVAKKIRPTGSMN